MLLEHLYEFQGLALKYIHTGRNQELQLASARRLYIKATTSRAAAPAQITVHRILEAEPDVVGFT